MSYVRLASKSDVPAGVMKAFDVGGGKKVLVANAEGSFFAIDNRCPHIGKPLDKGTLNGCTVTCAFHKAQFDLHDGKNVEDATLLFIRMHCKDALRYPLKIEGEQILVDIA